MSDLIVNFYAGVALRFRDASDEQLDAFFAGLPEPTWGQPVGEVQPTLEYLDRYGADHENVTVYVYGRGEA